MPEEKVVDIRSEDQLRKIMTNQALIKRRANTELEAIADRIPLPESEEQEIELGLKAIALETQLLEKYAKYPTLSEFVRNPSLHGLTQWGATFGVAVIMGVAVLPHIRVDQPIFVDAHRSLITILLDELAKPTDEDIVKALCAQMDVEVEVGAKLSLAAKAALVEKMMRKLVDTMLSVTAHFGMVVSSENDVTLTPLGQRVRLHMLDAQLFIHAVADAHKQFQIEKNEQKAA